MQTPSDTPAARLIWHIEALREPTDAMRAAVERNEVIQCGLDDCNMHDIPDKAWRIMIDEALKD